MSPFDVSYVAAAGAGVLTFLSPCILPLVPAYICFVTGHSLEEMTGTAANTIPTRGRQTHAALAGTAFVLGLGLVFVLLGAAASGLGQVLAEWRDVLSLAGGVLIIVFGLHYAGILPIAVLNFEKRIHMQRRPVGLLGAFLLGLAFGFGWTPCVGPVLASILMVAASGDSLWYGVTLLATYAAGLGLPFIAGALAISRLLGVLSRFRRHLGRIEKAMGGALIIGGILVLTGTTNMAGGWLLDLFPELGALH